LPSAPTAVTRLFQELAELNLRLRLGLTVDLENSRRRGTGSKPANMTRRNDPLGSCSIWFLAALSMAAGYCLDRRHSFHAWDRGEGFTLAELGSGEWVRTAGLPFTRSTAPCTVRASCTNGTRHRTNSTRCAGIIQSAVPRTVPSGRQAMVHDRNRA
jgi:hypothetical protein